MLATPIGYQLATADLGRVDIPQDVLTRIVASALQDGQPSEANQMFAALLQNMKRKNTRYLTTPFSVVANTVQQIVPENFFRKALVICNTLSTDVEISFDPGQITPPTNSGVAGWQTEATPSTTWFGIAYGAGMYVATGFNKIMTSPDGVTWTQQAVAGQWNGITYGGGQFVAVNSLAATAFTSPDGLVWTLHAVPSNNTWISVTYGNGLYVAIGQAGAGTRVMTSADGITWVNGAGIPNLTWNSVTFGNNTFVAVAETGGGNNVMSSPDGLVWTIHAATENAAWCGIAFGNNLFAAVSNAGTQAAGQLMTSPDGATWTAISPPQNTSWRSIAYGNGLFVAVAGSTLITNGVMISSDGVTWTSETTALSLSKLAVIYGSSGFVTVGQNLVNALLSAMLRGNGAPALPNIVAYVVPANSIKQFFNPPINAIVIYARNQAAQGLILEGY